MLLAAALIATCAGIAGGSIDAPPTTRPDVETHALKAVVDIDPYGVILSKDGSRLYATPQGGGSIQVFNTANLSTPVATIATVGGSAEMAMSPDGTHLYVNGYQGGTMPEIDTTTNTVIGTASTGASTTDMQVTPDGTRVYASMGSGVAVVNAADNSIIKTISTPGTAQNSIAITPDGKRTYAAAWSGTTGLYAIDSDPTSATYNSVRKVISLPSSSTNVALNPAGTRAYVTQNSTNSIAVVDTDRTTAAYETVIKNIAVGVNPFWAAVSPDGTRLYVTNSNDNTVSVIDLATDTVVSTVTSGGVQPLGAAVSPDGTTVYIANLQSSSIALVIGQPPLEAVTFNTNGGTPIPAESIRQGSPAVQPSPPTLGGSTFQGWSASTTGSPLWTWGTPINAPTTLYAVWAAVPPPPPPAPPSTETVTFIPVGGTLIPNEIVAYGSPAIRPASPTRAGYSFHGFWVLSGQPAPNDWVPWNFATPITGPTTIWAAWLPLPPTPVRPSPTPVPHSSSSSSSLSTLLGSLSAGSGPIETPPVVVAGGPSAGAGSGAATDVELPDALNPIHSLAHSGPVAPGSAAPKPGSLDAPSALTSPPIPNIYEVATHPEHIAAAIAAGLVWTLLLLLATSALDKVISSNYDSWTTSFGHRFPRISHAFGVIFSAGHNRTWLAILGVFATNAIVLDFVDPHFAVNLTSVRLLLSSTAALVIQTLVPCLVIIRIARVRYKTAGRIRATPFGLLIGAIGVVASRVMGFLPGLLAGSSVTYDEPTYKDNEKVWLHRLKIMLVLAVGALCWVGVWLVPTHGNPPTLFLRDAVVIVSASAFTSTVLELLPFAVFGGSHLWHHARITWVVLMTAAAAGFFLLVVPQPRYWLFVGPRLMWWSIIAIVVIFTAVGLVALVQRRAAQRAEAA